MRSQTEFGDEFETVAETDVARKSVRLTGPAERLFETLRPCIQRREFRQGFGLGGRMGTLIAIYVRASDPETAAAVRAAYPEAYTEPGSEFYAAEQTWFKPPVDDLTRLSAQLGTDVIWLAFQSAVDAFEFQRWQAGRLVRSLVYGCYGDERTWERAEGEPEPWEAGAIFGPEHLAHALRYADDAEAVELRRIWRETEIAPGRMEPILDAREVARAAAQFYRLPGWLC